MTEDRVPHPECVEAYHGQLIATGKTIVSRARLQADNETMERLAAAMRASAQPAPPFDVERLEAILRHYPAESES